MIPVGKKNDGESPGAGPAQNEALLNELLALRRSEAILRDFIETSNVSLHWVGADGIILWANQAELDLLGYSREEYIGRNIAEFHADELAIDDILCRLGRGETLSDYPARLRRRDGSIRHILINSSALFEDGKFVHTRCFTRDVTGTRKEHEASLLLSAIVDSSDDAIISKDLTGRITSWNIGAERIFGYSAQEAVGQSVTMLIPPQRLDEEPRILARLQRGERVDHFETIRRRKDGSLMDISLTISPVRDVQGRIVGASKIARDITERKRIDEAINRVNAQLQADLGAMTLLQQLSTRLASAAAVTGLLEEILDAGIATTGADKGNIQLLDEKGALVIAAQRGFRKPFLSFLSQASAGQGSSVHFLNAGERLVVEDITTSPLLDVETRGVLSEAGVRALQSTPLMSRSGRVLGLFSTHYVMARVPTDRDARLLDLLARLAADLVERKRAEEMRGQLSALVESSGDAIYMYDFEGRILTWNRAAEELYGYSYAEMLGKQSEIITPPDRRPELWRLIEAGRESGAVVRNLETTRMRRDGAVFPAMLTVSPVREESGKTVALSVVARDISARKQAEDELRRANEDLEQFAYSASHDLQEPLRTIKIYSELLAIRLGPAVEGEPAEFLSFLRNAATRMELLVRDLLAYTQVTRFGAPTEEVDLNEAVNAALGNLGGAIAESGATVTSDGLPVVHAHSAHMRQLFQNLIGNAIKYRSPERAPVVNVIADRGSGIWILTVRDNGIGIEPQYKEQIFGLFSRLHNDDHYTGTGIGLAICQRIVERYRGRIWVESEPGKGSSFHFTVPV